MAFTHLHLHTEYSFLDGFGHPEEYIKRAQALGLGAFAVTDHGGLWGWARTFKACREAGIKFIPGVEFFMDSPDVNKTQRRISWEHLTVLAADQTGYRNLLTLASLAGAHTHRTPLTYRPILTYPELFKHGGGLIVLSGCASGRVTRLIAQNNLALAYRVLQTFRRGFGDRFYVEIMPSTITEQRQANPVLVEMAHRLKIPLVATNDVHYISPEDTHTHEVMLCIQTRDVMSNPERWRFSWNGFYLAGADQMSQWFAQHHPQVGRAEVRGALESAATIAARCSVTQPIPTTYILPERVATTPAAFRAAAERGYRARGLHLRPNTAAYQQRLQHEVQSIVHQDLGAYLLIVADIMQ